MPFFSSRNFTQFTRALLLMVVGASFLRADDPSLQRDREDISINRGWKFIRSDEPQAERRNFKENGWKPVDLPHTWNVADATSPDYYRGPAWYRLHLDLPTHLVGRDLFLRFGAASLKAAVYVNGEWVGTHQGGYAAFCFNVTKQLHIGENIIAVQVDNSTDPNITPLSGDFTIYGGLYREVHLLALNPVSISPVDDASSGLYISTELGEKNGRVTTVAKLRNSRATRADIVVKTSLLDAERHIISKASTPASVQPGESIDVSSQLDIASPHRWNGLADPYQYSVIAQVEENKTLVDTVEQSFGFRKFEVSPEHGLILNGQPYDLHGVDYHQGRLSVGYADTAEMKEEDFQIIKEMGATGVRLAHYQHAEQDYALCDRSGLIAWAELAIVNRVTNTPQFTENCQQQLRELIKQNFNHPSIFFWSLYNELWTKPPALPVEDKLISNLAELAKSLDKSRLTTMAAAAGNDASINWYTDLTAINRYFGWYGGVPSDWGAHLDTLREKYPNKRIGIGEYGAGASISQHENNPSQPKPNSHWHPEEWQSIVHEEAWSALSKHEEIWCKFIWVMFDFASGKRDEGDHPGVNDKGLVTADRKTRKDAFYFYKAAWTQAPFVYITERRFTWRPAATATLKVYSNCNSVELYIDDKLLSQETGPTRVFVWPDVDLTPGVHHLKAVGSRNGNTYVDEITTQVVPPDAAPNSGAN